MVCVHYGPHGERLIRRGVELSEMLGSPLYVLNVESSDSDEYNQSKEMYMAVWKRLAEEAGAEFMVRKRRGRKTTDVIVEAAEEHEVTQIIIGQSAQTLWQELTKRNFVNELISKMKMMDLHVVAVQRMRAGLEETHEEGVTAYLVKNEGMYQLSDEPEGTDFIKGKYFHELHTEFENGLFKIEQDGKARYLHICEGNLADPL
ncbi:osmosensitive K+ channel histidine kinase [Paenibacillus sp. FSL R7-277]|uniref:universal stress protein n=1 Tax=Paenibacillus sp. FSL R7-277 TaxID=1227352 RepID=UPI0003E1DD53|nr:universal stress protein [Paenibacillus sp. FSL R7-277]ETT63243.1 osmosensitive K+ channel histidine kinase [Paenibacillus sp. FSL R7-277]